jgi:hypothetical protein
MTIGVVMTQTESLRTLLHTRKFLYECYLRDDGLWDIDAELSDTKEYPYALHTHTVPAGEPLHKMQIRLTVDDVLTIRDIVSSTLHAPFPQCARPGEPMQVMIGVTIGPGWRKEVERRIGGVKGCTHLRDLLLNAATAAFQSVTAHALHNRLLDRSSTPAHVATPHFLGKCATWALDGPAVKEYEPAFYKPGAQEPDGGN